MPILVAAHNARLHAAAIRELEPAATLLTLEDAATADIPAADIWLADPDTGVAAYRRLLDRPDAPLPQWIQSTWAGITPWIEPLQAAGGKTRLTGLRDIFGSYMSEYVFAHLLAHHRQLARLQQAQAQRRWHADLPHSLVGSRMTVIGAGSIGAAIARTARHFGMTVTGVARRPAPRPDFDRMLATSDLAEAVRDADAVVAVLPDTPATRGLIDAGILRAMPPHAMFINVGRAASLDHDALARVLADGHLASVVLDVQPEEPLPPAHPLWGLPRTHITPHIAAVSHPQDIARCFLANLQRWRNGQPLQALIDLDRGY